MRLFLLLLSAATMAGQSIAQKPKNYSSADIQHMLNKLNVLGTVLYVAAHPDDENTKVITWLAKEKQFYAAYLSATRGDGGQNLIGPESREALGVIRTQELLAARAIDGGQQFFTRANDFGYSKTPEETLEIWDRDQVLSDFVLAYRKFKPDVIITRFAPDGSGGHGHHTVSAILAREAYELAGDKQAFPESAERYGTWQPKRLYFNTHAWFYSRRGAVMDTSKYYVANIGGYNPLLGLSHPEIAALSRSQHKSQGFGTTGTRGDLLEFFELMNGEAPAGKPEDADIFDGIDTSWARLVGSKKIVALIRQIQSSYDLNAPESIVPQLIALRKEIEKVQNEFWGGRKLAEVDELIKACLGLYLEVSTVDNSCVPEDTLKFTAEIINRSRVDVVLKGVSFNLDWKRDVNERLVMNQGKTIKGEISLPRGLPYSHPYWLEEQATLGMYSVKDSDLIGLPVNPSGLIAKFFIEVDGTVLSYTSPVVYKMNDPVAGEVYKSLEILPPVMANVQDGVYVFNGSSKEIEVTITAGRDRVSGQVRLNVPSPWKVSPEVETFDITQKSGDQRVRFTVTPPNEASIEEASVELTYAGEHYDRSLVRIVYDHIPNQVILPKARARFVKVELEKKGDKIAYINGAGDQIPSSLRQVGYAVDELADDQLNLATFSKYDAVIVGIRAFNTNDQLALHTTDLHAYAHQGGTVIVQYNTSHRLNTSELAPYKLSLSRDRITKEEAEVTIIAPAHQVMNAPNKISTNDFDGWVQERGLYFPDSWGEEFVPILSCHDPNEPVRDGGLLIANHGEGYFIYTGYSWFRQLPAGVPGAYRIFTNLISIGK